LNLDPALIEFLFGLNFRSYLLCSKVAANDMVARGVKGNIVFITSTRGIRAYPEDALYGGFKAALNRAAESIALNLAKYHIRVNCVAPGATAVRGDYSPEELAAGFGTHVPLGRRGTPREVGYLVRYIASDEADYMTGDIIKLDGGLILPGMPERGDPWPKAEK
jgi:NAD(P)-dependent dehydrogenase (short-subunit alcohol dehydrogenase family)